MTEPFNPLNKENLGKSIAYAMLEADAVPLASLKSFEGAGIYALYYTGNFPAYEPLSAQNRDGAFRIPIYVGSAVPPGGRKAGYGMTDTAHTKLYGRLSKHSQSIAAASNLDINDFYCRYLIVDDIWIPLGESLLIAWYTPVWNQKLDGFGNHDPGSGRYGQLRSPWDVVHPGRAWAIKCAERNESQEALIQDITSYLRTYNFRQAHLAGSR